MRCIKKCLTVGKFTAHSVIKYLKYTNISTQAPKQTCHATTKTCGKLWTQEREHSLFFHRAQSTCLQTENQTQEVVAKTTSHPKPRTILYYIKAGGSLSACLVTMASISQKPTALLPKLFLIETRTAAHMAHSHVIKKRLHKRLATPRWFVAHLVSSECLGSIAFGWDLQNSYHKTCTRIAMHL